MIHEPRQAGSANPPTGIFSPLLKSLFRKSPSGAGGTTVTQSDSLPVAVGLLCSSAATGSVYLTRRITRKVSTLERITCKIHFSQ